MIGGSNKFILVYLILSHNYTHDSSLLHQHLYMSFFARQPSAMPRYLSHWLRSLGVFESWRLLQFGCTIPVLTHTIETRSPQFVHIWWLLYNYIYTSIIYSSLCIYISICIILTSSWWKGHWLASWWLFRLPRLDALLHSRIVWHLPLLSSRPCGPARGPGCLWWFQHVSTIDFPNHQRLSGWTQSSHSDPKCVSSLNYLVGGIPTPLKNMSSSVGTIIPNIWKNNKCSKPATSYDLLSTEF